MENIKKDKLRGNLREIYNFMSEERYITIPYQQFKQTWKTTKYERGLSGLGFDILYFTITQNMEELIKIKNKIVIDCKGNIGRFLRRGSYIAGTIEIPKKGLSLFGWNSLQRLCCGDLDFFEKLYTRIQKQ